MYECANNVCVKKNAFAGKILNLKILRCFVEKVSNVAILHFLVSFFGTFWNFIFLFGIFCTIWVFWAFSAVLSQIRFVVSYPLFWV